MSLTIKNVRSKLEPDELDYEKVATQLGPKAIPHLKELVKDKDTMIASKATYAASLIDSTESISVIEAAARNSEPVVRVAAASSLRNLKEKNANKVSNLLIKDKDKGVRIVTLKSIANFKSPDLVKKIKMVAEKDPEEYIRKLAKNMIKRQTRINKKERL